MSEIKNGTMNFSYGRSQCELNLLRKLAFTEIHRMSTGISLMINLELVP